MRISNYEKTHKHITAAMKKIQMPATNKLPFPYTAITTDEKIYGTTVFSWDNYHMALRYAYDGNPDYLRFLVDNLTRYQRRNGFTPNCVNKDSGDAFSLASKFHAQPFLARAAFLYNSVAKDTKWLASAFKRIRKYLGYYDTLRSAEGLHYWRHTWQGGIDNDIATTMFRPGTVISPDLQAALIVEHTAASKIARELSMTAEAREHAGRAAEIKRSVNKYFWDKKNGTYAAWDSGKKSTRLGYSDKFLNSQSVGLYSFQSCSNLMPLFAGAADKDQAGEMIEKYVLSEEHFRCKFGLRSLSRSSEYYNNAVWGNPPRFGDMSRLTNSNWQGPVWILTAYFGVNLLVNYGHMKEAEKLADDTVELLAKSLDEIGSFTENYDAETGKPLYAQNFASWNILADILHFEAKNPAQRKLALVMDA